MPGGHYQKYKNSKLPDLLLSIYKLLNILAFKNNWMHYKNILLIDDDYDDHQIFLLALKKISDTVECIAMDSAVEAYEKLSAKDLAPDLIFLDLNMPVLHGQEFLRKLKRSDTLKDIPVIIFSTSSHSTTIQRTKELGAHDFIIKPGKFNELVNILTPYFKN